MKNLNFRTLKKTAKITRFLIVVLILPSLLWGGMPFSAQAAVPTWVVLFDANTAFETSLETFMFDLFNTLQRRQEDFTAAFELQKIEKAREDVNKLFLETQEELQNFGALLDYNGPGDPGPDAAIRDPRFTGTEQGTKGTQGEDCTPSGSGVPGCPPLISPIKDSRIIHDPYQYLFGDAYTKAQLYLYCYFNYLIWDQRGLLPSAYPFLDNQTVAGIPDWYNQQKRTYDSTPSNPPNPNDAAGMERSIKQLLRVRNTLVVQFHRGNYYMLNFPLQVIYGNASAAKFSETEPRCRQVMYTVGAESPVTIEQNVELWKELMKRNNAWTDPNNQQLINQEIQEFRQGIWFLPTLQRSIARRAPNDPWTWSEYDRATNKTNGLTGVTQVAVETAQRIIEETQTERQATYIAGQGFRPETLHVGVQQQDDQGRVAQFFFNTEYVIAPAAILLQKMQAANQAMFDLAGQGFLYLDPDDSPSNLLAKYRLATTATQAAERRICNQAGSCALLDPWLKPAASFRTAASLQTTSNGDRVPRLVGTAPDYAAVDQKALAGSGLPAPWEDYTDFLNLSNEKYGRASDNNGNPIFPTQVGGNEYNPRRYTIARFRVFNRDPAEPDTPSFLATTAGRDEFDYPGRNLQDNIGRKSIGADFAINDWYDRVFEMYESGIGTGPLGIISERNARYRDFTVRDWQCYVATWFIPQEVFTDNNRAFWGGAALGQNQVRWDQTFERYCQAGTQPFTP